MGNVSVEARNQMDINCIIIIMNREQRVICSAESSSYISLASFDSKIDRIIQVNFSAVKQYLLKRNSFHWAVFWAQWYDIKQSLSICKYINTVDHELSLFISSHNQPRINLQSPKWSCSRQLQLPSGFCKIPLTFLASTPAPQ